MSLSLCLLQLFEIFIFNRKSRPACLHPSPESRVGCAGGSALMGSPLRRWKQTQECCGFLGLRRDTGSSRVSSSPLPFARPEGAGPCYSGCCTHRDSPFCQRRLLCTSAPWWNREFWGHKCQPGPSPSPQGFVPHLEAAEGLTIDFYYIRL